MKAIEVPLLPGIRQQGPLLTVSRPPVAKMPSTLRTRPKPYALKSSRGKGNLSCDLISEDGGRDRKRGSHTTLEKVVIRTQLEKLLASKRGVLEPRNVPNEGGPLLRQLYENWSLEYKFASSRKPDFDTSGRTREVTPSISLRKKETRAKSTLHKPKQLPEISAYPELTVTCQGLLKESKTRQRAFTAKASAVPLRRPESCVESTLYQICGILSEPSTRSASVPRQTKFYHKDRQTDTKDLEENEVDCELIEEMQSRDENESPNKGWE